jgi:hypothetical protein
VNLASTTNCPRPLLAFALLAATVAAHASVINVPGDQPTIQAGINVATNGDTVLVAPGTYNQAINFAGKAITLQSTGGPNLTTITAMGLNTSTVNIPTTSGAGQDVIDGFTITGGNGTHSGSTRTGGGIIMSASSNALILNCRIVNNSVNVQAGEASCAGGGISIGGANSMLTLRNCEISSNTAIAPNAAGAGGGIATGIGSRLTMIACTVASNMAGSSGGGMELGGNSASNFMLVSCAIRSNQANGTNFAGGAGLRALFGTLTLVNCLVADNVGTQTGTQQSTAGVLTTTCATVKLFNCTIARNLLQGPAAAGSAGGVSVALVGPPTCQGNGTTAVHNCIVWANSMLQVNGSVGTSVDYSAIDGGYFGAGNIAADPQFVDAPNGNYRLAAPSPCRDTADRMTLPADAFDLDSDANVVESLSRDLALLRRVVNGQVDMGAYEWQRTCLADISRSSPGVAGNGVVDIDDLLAVINGWGTCDQCVADVNGDDQANIDDLLAVITGWAACP